MRSAFRLSAAVLLSIHVVKSCATAKNVLTNVDATINVIKVFAAVKKRIAAVMLIVMRFI